MTTAPLRGGCHCGAITVALATTQSPDALHPRACDCAFCMKHGAGWVSDPAGRLTVTVQRPEALGDYRQGSGNARFVVCRDCGVLVAVLHAFDEGLRGAANARCLDAAPVGDAMVVSPQQLSRDAKLERWAQAWTPADLLFSGARPA